MKMAATTASPMKRVQQVWQNRLQKLSKSPPNSLVIDEDIEISTKLSMIHTDSNNNNTTNDEQLIAPAVPYKQPTSAVPLPSSAENEQSNSSPPDSFDPSDPDDLIYI